MHRHEIIQFKSVSISKHFVSVESKCLIPKISIVVSLQGTGKEVRLFRSKQEMSRTISKCWQYREEVANYYNEHLILRETHSISLGE